MAFLVKFLDFSQNYGYLLIIWVKTSRNLMDNLGKNWQLINILFCAINDDQKSDISHTPKMCAETYTHLGTDAPASYYKR